MAHGLSSRRGLFCGEAKSMSSSEKSDSLVDEVMTYFFPASSLITNPVLSLVDIYEKSFSASVSYFCFVRPSASLFSVRYITSFSLGTIRQTKSLEDCAKLEVMDKMTVRIMIKLFFMPNILAWFAHFLQGKFFEHWSHVVSCRLLLWALRA